MAKKFVRGITDVKTINNQDFDTNNVNDLLSDGQYNYIHRKKGKTEEYHNLTDNIKTISSDNTELLAVTNNNKTTNTATLHPKHDAQKEQVLESTRNTVNIQHGTNGTAEKTTVDTNPKKVLEHEKLKTGDGLTTSFNTDETTIRFKATKKPPETNLNILREGIIRGKGFSIDQVPSGDKGNSAAYIILRTDETTKMQLYFRESNIDAGKIVASYRFIKNEVATQWKEMAVDSDELLKQLGQKQDTLVAGSGITIQGNTISASGTTSTVQYFTSTNFKAYMYRVVTSDTAALTTFSFECYNAAETVLTGELKEQLKDYVPQNTSISNGAISITNDGTTMKLINSSPSGNVYQHATFTFNGNTGS